MWLEQDTREPGSYSPKDSFPSLSLLLQFSPTFTFPVFQPLPSIVPVLVKFCASRLQLRTLVHFTSLGRLSVISTTEVVVDI